MKIEFEIYHPGEMAAGIFPYEDKVTVTVEHDPGGEKGEFEEYMRESLAEWFDGAHVSKPEPCGHHKRMDCQVCET